MTAIQGSDTVAMRIRQARQHRGWSQAELGKRCELSGDVIQHIESGRRDADGRRRRDITVDELLAIADAFQMSVRDLLPAAALKPDHTERERRVKMAAAEIEQEEVKIAALREVADDLNRQISKLEAERVSVYAQMGAAQRKIKEIKEMLLVSGYDPADD